MTSHPLSKQSALATTRTLTLTCLVPAPDCGCLLAQPARCSDLGPRGSAVPIPGARSQRGDVPDAAAPLASGANRLAQAAAEVQEPSAKT
eukprot:652316-Rhodomonas_salina.1